MSISPITKEQWLKVGKATLYVAGSAALSFLIAETTNNPELFGALTPIINIALVLIKQALTKEK